MDPVRALRSQSQLTQAQLAAAAGTSQPTVAAYEAGRKSPTVRTLARFAAAAGLELAVVFVPPMTREDRRSLELHHAIARLLAREPESVLRTARTNLRRMAEAGPGARELLAEWRRSLMWPLDELVALLTDPSQRARELRQVTPFAGVLSPRDRWQAYRRFRDESLGR